MGEGDWAELKALDRAGDLKAGGNGEEEEEEERQDDRSTSWQRDNQPSLCTAVNSRTVYEPVFTWHKADNASCTQGSRSAPALRAHACLTQLRVRRKPAQRGREAAGCEAAGPRVTPVHPTLSFLQSKSYSQSYRQAHVCIYSFKHYPGALESSKEAKLSLGKYGIHLLSDSVSVPGKCGVERFVTRL